MKRLVVSAVLVLVAATLIVSVSYGAREEIVLRTIIPDQHVLRVQKGIVSVTNYKPSVFPNDSIPEKSLIIEGNVGIGTTSSDVYDNKQVKLDVNGYSAMKDVWLKDADGGVGKWASEAGGGDAYDGGESITLPNGLIIKQGYYAAPDGTYTVNFETPFPTACLNVQLTPAGPDYHYGTPTLRQKT